MDASRDGTTLVSKGRVDGLVFSASAEAMRRILIDRARRKHACRHGGGQERLDIDDVQIEAPLLDEEILAVDDALEQFAQHSPKKAELVKLRYFVGLGMKEAGQALGISEPTASGWPGPISGRAMPTRSNIVIR